MAHQQQITSVERMRFFKDEAPPVRTPPPRSSESILAWDTETKSSGSVASTPPRGRGGQLRADRPSPILAWNDKQFGRSFKPDPTSQTRSGRRNVSSTDLSWKEEHSRPHKPHEKLGPVLPHHGIKNVSSNDFEWDVEPTNHHSNDGLRSRPQRFLKKQGKEDKQENRRPQGDGLVHRQRQGTPTGQTRHSNSEAVQAKPNPKKSLGTRSLTSLASDESSQIGKPHPKKSLGTQSLVSLASDESSQVGFMRSRASKSMAQVTEARVMTPLDDCQSHVSGSTTSEAFPAKQEDAQSYFSGSAISELRPAIAPKSCQDHRELDRRPHAQHSDAGNSRASSSYQRSDAGNSRASSYTHGSCGKKGASSQSSQAHRVCPGGELRPVPGGELRPLTPSKRGNTPRSARTPSEVSKPAFSPMPRSNSQWLADAVTEHKLDRSCSVASTSVYGSASGVSDAWDGASGYASTAA